MELEERETAARDAEPEDVAHEPGAEECSGVDRRTHGRHGERGAADHEGAALERREVIVATDPVHGAPSASSRARASAGTSANSARWLRCKARTYAAIAQRSRAAT